MLFGLDGLVEEMGVDRMSLAPVDPCLGLRPRTERVPSSENSEESSSPVMIDSQGLHTRSDADCPKCAPDTKDVHFASNICPQVPISEVNGKPHENQNNKRLFFGTYCSGVFF